MLKILILLGIFFLQNVSLVFAQNISLEAKFPYLLSENLEESIATYSTKALYLNIENRNNKQADIVEVEINIPKNLEIAKADWQVLETENSYLLKKTFKIEPAYGNNFELLYFKALPNLPLGENKISLKLKSSTEEITKDISFQHILGELQSKTSDSKKLIKENWYIHNFVLPVDSNGIKDDRVDAGTIYIKDISLETLRNKFLGEGVVNWSKVYNHPATFVSLELRNPNMDTRLVKFRAELLDKNTGKVLPGLTTAGQVNENQENYNQTGDTASLALLALTGKKNQIFTLPLYIDYAQIIPGEYVLKLTLSSGQEDKIREVPIKIIKNRVSGMYALAISCASFLTLILLMYKLKTTIAKIAAKGAITIALFAAISFGCITVPTTFLGDLLQVFLVPFSGLITGLLSGIVLYSLVVALLVLYREAGVVALFFLLKLLLAALLFGRITPLGLLMCAVNIVFIEIALQITNFYKPATISKRRIIAISLALGITDASITYVNLEQMMFFYRLYYASWYIGLHMLFNGILYSSIGSYLGFKLGDKLQQIMGE